MRKVLGVLFAASLAASITMVASGSAGAAAKLKCTSVSGSQSYNPGLPKSGDSKKVKPKTTTHIKISGCSGVAGIKSGTSDSLNVPAKDATNCNTLIANAIAKKPAKPVTGTIKWNNKKTSATSTVLTVTGIVNGGKQLTANLVTTYKSGVGAGQKSTVKVLVTPNAGWCKTAAFKSVTFKSTSIK